MSYASLVDIPLKNQYRTNPKDGATVVAEFYEPVLSVASQYDRLSGYYSSASLCLAAKGVASLIANGGKMRLVCSPNLSGEDARLFRALASGKDEDGIIDEYWDENFPPTASEIERDHVAALGWMYNNGLLDIRLAVLQNDASGDGSYLCHPKIGIVKDFAGNVISFSGSNNETVGGWAANQEEFKVFKGWTEEGLDYLKEDRWCFENYWDDRMPGVKTYDLPTALSNRLIRASSNFEKENYLAKYYIAQKTRIDAERKLSLRPYQKDAIEKWRDNGFKLLFEMATGSGKTRTAIGCINAMMEVETSCCIVVAAPRIALCQQWRHEMAGVLVKRGREITANSSNSNWRGEFASSLASIATGTTKTKFIVVYASHATAAGDDFLSRIKYASSVMPIMLVADEAHGLGALKLQRALVPYSKYRVGLSATPTRLFDEPGTKLIVEYFGNNSFVFSIGQALKAGYLSQYLYYPILVPFSAEEDDKYEDLTERIRRLRSAYDNDPSEDIYARLEKAMRDRADLVQSAKGKLQSLAGLLTDRAKDVASRAIVFTCHHNINSVLGLYEDKGIMARRYTSRESMPERARLLQLFSDGDCDVLVAMKCLDEGIDIPSARCAVLVSSTVNPREYIQRIGRVIRRAKDKENAVIYDFLVTRYGSGEIIERDLTRGEYIAEFAINATNAYDILYRKEKIHYEHENT